MAEYNPSKIIKDGNTYNFRDTTKIPLAGSNAISGSLIPSTNGTVNLGGSSYQWNNAYIKSLTINGVACGDILTHNVSEFVPRSGGAVITSDFLGRTDSTGSLNICGGSNYNNGSWIALRANDPNTPHEKGAVIICANDGSNSKRMNLFPNGIAKWGGKILAMQEDVVPRSGGAVLTGNALSRTIDNGELRLDGGTVWNDGASISISGKNRTNGNGNITLHPSNGSNSNDMFLNPDGTWIWGGTACQIISDQRLKQQITEIDDKLLDAWEDVNLVQFKYNDAVKEKSDNARLHTGYVVQQIDNACKSHGVDVSQYGLYCHEEYPQEVEEVEVEKADGTKVKETKVIREASEHYSLRYTEVYAVECMYLRRCIERLTARIEELEKGNNSK